MSSYRAESESIFEYDAEQKVYLFIGKPNGDTRRHFIREYVKIGICKEAEEETFWRK